MRRVWKPGDVALIRASAFDGEAVGLRTGVSSNRGWAYTSPDDARIGNCWISDARGARVVRPLVVIDPEDREQVERLTSALRFYRLKNLESLADNQEVIDTQAALREFADLKPPRPDEPTRLGAVVEDAEGADWHRTRDGRWIAEDGLRSRACGWGHIDVVRVLSEGVQP